MEKIFSPKFYRKIKPAAQVVPTVVARLWLNKPIDSEIEGFLINENIELLSIDSTIWSKPILRVRWVGQKSLSTQTWVSKMKYE